MNNSGKAKIIIIVLASLLILSLTACGILASKLISAENELNIDKQWHSKAISPSEASLDGIYSEEYMQKAIYNAVHNEGIGGPVGAVITKKNGELVVSTGNQNRKGSSMLHGEVCAIYEAQMILGTKDLTF